MSEGMGEKNNEKSAVIIGDGKGIRWQAKTEQWCEVGLKDKVK